jgi:large exoprotein involved in heme utilization and adhesion
VTVTTTDALLIAGQDPTGAVLSGVFSQTFGAGDAGRVAITTGQLRLEDRGRLSVDTGGDGRGGDLTVQARQVTISGGAQLNSRSGLDVGNNVFLVGAGAGGSVTVTATDTVTITGQASGIAATTVGQGAGGDMMLQARNITLSDGALLAAETKAAGSAGRITLNAGTVVATGGLLSSSSTGQATGAAGTVTLHGRGGLGTVASTVTLTDSILKTLAEGDGVGGSIQLDATTVTLDRATLSATTTGTGRAGAITLVEADTLRSTNSRLTTEATTGVGGAVTLAAHTALDLTGTTVSATVLSGEQAGGTIILRAPTVVVTGGALQAATAGVGRGGDVVVESGALTLTGGARLDSSTSGAGPGGTVTVRATDTITIVGPESGLFTTAADRGAGGDILLETRALTLGPGAIIAAESRGLGNAGDIHLMATDTFLSTHGKVTTEATKADGGEITVQTQHMIRLRDSAITATVGGGAATMGGNITIDPEFLLLERSQIRADAFAGQGGNIRITAGVLLADPASSVSASSALGIRGTVDIRAPIADLSGTVVPLPQTFAQTATLLRQRCAERLREGKVSSFVLAGRGGIPASPEGGLPSPLYQANQAVVTGSKRPQESAAMSPTEIRDVGDNRQARGQRRDVQGFSPVPGIEECARWLGERSTTSRDSR